MPLGVTTLAQFNGTDGLGDDASTTQMYVGIGSIAVLLAAMVVAGGTARSLARNPGRRRISRKHRWRVSLGPEHAEVRCSTVHEAVDRAARFYGWKHLDDVRADVLVGHRWVPWDSVSRAGRVGGSRRRRRRGSKR